MTTKSRSEFRLFNKPLMIGQPGHDEIMGGIAQGGDGSAALRSLVFVESRSLKPYTVTAGGIAVMSIAGLLVNRERTDNDGYGLLSYERIMRDVGAAASDPAVKGILLDFDTYGGESDGAWDAARAIEEAGRAKPVWACAYNYALSAGYLLASACSRIWVTDTSAIGSIGVLAMHVDISQFDEKLGLKYTTIYAGARKNDYNPHEPLSDAARENLTAYVDRLYGLFVEHVAKQRKQKASAVRALDAAVIYSPDQALSSGLADSVGSFEAALSQFRRNLNGRGKTGPVLIAAPDAAATLEEGEVMSEETSPIAAAENPVAPEASMAATPAVAPATPAANADMAEIVALCAVAGTPATQAHEYITRNMTAADVRAALIAARATAADQTEIVSQVQPATGVGAQDNTRRALTAAVDKMKGGG